MQQIVITILILSLGAAPIGAAVNDPLSCNAKKCCHPRPEHHLMAGILDAGCQCDHLPLAPCHLESDPSLPQQVVILINDRSHQNNLPVLSASADSHQCLSVLASRQIIRQAPGPADRSPPLYLLTCTFII